MTIEYKTLEHWIPKQAAAEKAMLEELEAGNYTIENPLVKYNVYFINPLSAVVLFKTEEKVPVTVTVVGKTKSTTITHTFPAATTHILPIVGLYNNYNNTVILTPYRGTSSTIHIEVPDCVPDIVCHMDTTPEYLQDDIICVLPAAQTPASGFDNNGDCRWYINALCVFDMKRLKNGNLLMGSDRLLKMPYYMTGLYELSPCGKIYKEYRIPGGYHHDQVEMEDG
ncbi:MAG: aryl-sulfate sulfotransferase, partial [Erysipelotrichaceae bacterium]|nr:aryl-sulfate sulfotransferase [Erysipelotrichaceae bacterium]